MNKPSPKKKPSEKPTKYSKPANLPASFEKAMKVLLQVKK